MDSSTEQLYEILNGRWKPDGDRHALILDGDCRFAWVGGVILGANIPIKYEDDRPKPSSGDWSVECTKLVLRGPGENVDRVERIEYTVEHNSDGTELTLTDPSGRSQRLSRTGDTEKEHPPEERPAAPSSGCLPARTLNVTMGLRTKAPGWRAIRRRVDRTRQYRTLLATRSPAVCSFAGTARCGRRWRFPHQSGASIRTLWS